MRKYVDKGIRELEFNIRDLVFLRIDGDHFKPAPGTSKLLTR